MNETLSVRVWTGTQVSVSFNPNLPVWRFIREILVPELGGECMLRDNGTSLTAVVCGDFRGRSGFLAHSNRKMLLKDVFPLGTKIMVLPRIVFPTSWFFGNSVGWDVNDDCPICLEPRLDFALDSCGHCFHAHCLALNCSVNTRCPMCRGNISVTDAVKLLDRIES